MKHRLTMLSIGCGILIAIPLSTTTAAPINWLKDKANTFLFYCKKGAEPMKYTILGFLAIKSTACITRHMLEIKIPYTEKTLDEIPVIKHTMPSYKDFDRNTDYDKPIHHLKAIPWTIGFLFILGYAHNKWEKRKENKKRSSFFY
jgi:hypothetical protein